MLLFFGLDYYWSKRPDPAFRSFWERWVLKRTRKTTSWLPLHYFIGVFLLYYFVIGGSDNIFLEVILLFMSMIGYGVLYVLSFLRFLARGNQRYLRSQFGSSSDTFDKSNVVYEEKKR